MNQSDTEVLKALVELIRKHDALENGGAPYALREGSVVAIFRAACAAESALERLLASPDANRQDPVAWAEKSYGKFSGWVWMSLQEAEAHKKWCDNYLGPLSKRELVPLYAHPAPSVATEDAIMEAARAVQNAFIAKLSGDVKRAGGYNVGTYIMPLEEIASEMRRHLGERRGASA